MYTVTLSEMGCAVVFSYRLVIACETGPSAPSVPLSRSSENAHVNRSITDLTRKLVMFHSCAAAHCRRRRCRDFPAATAIEQYQRNLHSLAGRH